MNFSLETLVSYCYPTDLLQLDGLAALAVERALVALQLALLPVEPRDLLVPELLDGLAKSVQRSKASFARLFKNTFFRKTSSGKSENPPQCGFLQKIYDCGFFRRQKIEKLTYIIYEMI